MVDFVLSGLLVGCVLWGLMDVVMRRVTGRRGLEKVWF
jgi:hypothetical protein